MLHGMAVSAAHGDHQSRQQPFSCHKTAPQLLVACCNVVYCFCCPVRCQTIRPLQSGCERRQHALCGRHCARHVCLAGVTGCQVCNGPGRRASEPISASDNGGSQSRQQSWSCHNAATQLHIAARHVSNCFCRPFDRLTIGAPQSSRERRQHALRLCGHHSACQVCLAGFVSRKRVDGL
jgi:hypothetical protein